MFSYIGMLQISLQKKVIIDSSLQNTVYREFFQPKIYRVLNMYIYNMYYIYTRLIRGSLPAHMPSIAIQRMYRWVP